MRSPLSPLQLEEAGLLESYDPSTGGRRVTSVGQREMDTVARSVTVVA